MGGCVDRKSDNAAAVDVEILSAGAFLWPLEGVLSSRSR
jgi:hypothetical protein